METKYNIQAKNITTYGGKGVVKEMLFPETVNDVKEIFKSEGSPFILGGGSNTLIPDGENYGSVVSFKKLNKVEIDGDTVTACGGVYLSRVIKIARQYGLGGLEFMSGVPATMGGLVRMNAGAFGQETFDTLEYFDVIDRQGRPATLLKEDLKYTYRHVEGIEDYIVLSASFKLTPADFQQLLETRNSILHKRIEKQPLDYPSAGSVFKRPVNDYASRLIDDTGLRGLSVGGAKISEKHAGFIINFNHATPEDIRELMRQVRQKVKEKHGIELELEQILWGQFE